MIPSERTSKTMGTHVENDWNHALDEKLSLVKEVTGLDCGGWGLGQSGSPRAPGGECFASNHQRSSQTTQDHSRAFLTWGNPYCIGIGVRSTLLPVYHENHVKIMKQQISLKSQVIIPNDSGSLQSISNDYPVSPNACLIDFTNIVCSLFSTIF